MIEADFKSRIDTDFALRRKDRARDFCSKFLTYVASSNAEYLAAVRAEVYCRFAEQQAGPLLLKENIRKI